MIHTLSKSDYLIARSCLKKLWYRKQQYPTSSEGSEYMEMLADGGFMVGKMAQLLYPDGIEITGNTEEALKKTKELLQQENVVLFEAAIKIGPPIIRIDVLVKKGNLFKIIEVKSRSFSLSQALLAKSNNKSVFRSSYWQSIIEDITFQKLVLQKAYPATKISCELLMPDTDKTTPIEGLLGMFSLENAEMAGTFKKVKVNFDGDIIALQNGHNLSLINVDDEVNYYSRGVNSMIVKYINALKLNTPEAFASDIGLKCKGCEYWVANDEPRNGFRECWGKGADSNPHILELGQLGNVNNRAAFKNCIEDLIKRGKTALLDVPVEYVSNEDPDKPFQNNRPLYQLSRKDEFMLPGFMEATKDLEYPLHFLDFETSQMAIPYHAGMKAYGKVLFQWSCHTISAPGEEYVHAEWINTTDSYPNLEFAHSLKKHIGDHGTIMTWSAYENTQLKTVKKELEEIGILSPEDAELLEWLTAAAKNHDGDTTRLCDMNQLAIKYYFHPRMGGRTSIKVTLPAVLEATNSEKIKNWLTDENLYQTREDGIPIDPYQLLPEVEIMSIAEKVKDGSGAMRAYQDMLYGIHKNDEATKMLYRDALLKYCKLDTLAMVIIWEHWSKFVK